MKRNCLLVLLALFFLIAFPGCKSNFPEEPASGTDGESASDVASQTTDRSGESPLRVLIDIVPINYSDPGQTTVKEENAAEEFLQAVEKEGGPQDVVVEAMPVSQEEREAALTRVRAEIMAGGGPDVFIIGPANAVTADAVFQFPKSAMANEIFLPLDEYLPSAQFMDWEKQTKVIMEAGNWEGCQLLLPMSYSFPMTVFRKADYDPELSPDMTWDEMRASEDLCLRACADCSGNGQLGGREYSPFLSLFGEGADYKESKLLFTEEEMVKRAKEAIDLSQQQESGKFDSVPERYCTELYVNCDDEEWQMSEFNHAAYLSQPIGKDEAITIVPFYSLQGGVTATVNAYTGINRNTARPEDAFFLVDLLLSKKQQTTSPIYRMLCDESYGIPVQADLLENNGNILGWTMQPENVEEFQSVREYISAVRYRTPIDHYLALTRAALRFGTLEEQEKEARENYRQMVQELQE